jgi:hypothetical protein
MRDTALPRTREELAQHPLIGYDTAFAAPSVAKIDTIAIARLRSRGIFSVCEQTPIARGSQRCARITALLAVRMRWRGRTLTLCR